MSDPSVATGIRGGAGSAGDAAAGGADIAAVGGVSAVGREVIAAVRSAATPGVGVAAVAVVRVDREEGEASPVVEAAWPDAVDGSGDASWLVRARELAGSAGDEDARPAVVRLHADTPAGRTEFAAITVGLRADGEGRRVVVLLIARPTERAIEMGVVLGLLARQVGGAAVLARRAHDRDEADERVASAFGVVGAFNAHGRLFPAVQSLADHLASALDADRVSIGVMENGDPRVIAISHTEKFSRKQAEVREIEDVMAECADQGEVVSAGSGGSDGVLGESGGALPPVNREHAEFSARRSGVSVVSVPVVTAHGVSGVVTAERSGRAGFDRGALAIVETVCDLIGARLVDLRASDRWIGAKVGAELRRGAATLVGPRHTVAKVVAVVVLVALVAAAVIPVDRAATGAFTVVPNERRVLTAPFAGFVSRVTVRAQAEVAAGDVLVELSTTDLRLERAATAARLASALDEAAAARAEGEATAARLAETRAEEARASLALLDERIASAAVVTPIAGTVVSEDPASLVGARVSAGDALVRVVDTGSVFIELLAPERAAGELAVGQRVELSPASDPGRTVGARVTRVSPVVRVAESGAGVRVEAQIDGDGAGVLKPGGRGVGRVATGRGSALSVWTRELTDWLRVQWFKL